MAGGVVALANAQVKFDSNGYLLVTIGGGAITPDTITLDNTNRDTVLARATTGNLALYATGAAGATNAFRLMNGTNAGAALEWVGLSWASNVGQVGTVLNGGTARNLRLQSAGGNINFNGTSGDTVVMNVTSGVFTKYGNVTAVGLGMPAIYAAASVAAQTTAAAAIATYTTPNATGDYEVSGNVNITASATHSFSLNCNYTDEGGSARVLVLPLAQLAGTFVASGLITNVTGTGPYESAAMHIRCKATTAITIQTPAGGTFTSVTYNAAGVIRQLQ